MLPWPSSFSARLRLGSIIVVVAAILAVGFALDRFQRQTRQEELAVELENSIQANGRRLQQRVDELRQDSLFLAALPLSGLPRGGGAQPIGRRLEEIFQAFAESHPQYFKIRYIGLADGGRELARVDSRSGRIVIAPAGELERVGEEEFFRQAGGLKRGQVYLSPFGLSREGGGIDVPHRPAILAATPVLTAEGRLQGVLAVSMAAAEMLDVVANGLPFGAKAYVADRFGRYLATPDPGLAFAFEFGDERRLTKDFPVLSGDGGHPLQPETRLEAGKLPVTFFRVRHDPLQPDDYLLLAYVLPEEALASGGLPRERFILFALLAGLVIGGLVSLLLGRLFSPLAAMTRAAEAIAAGDRQVPLPAVSGELGALAGAFRNMLEKLDERDQACRRLNAELEERVNERTAQLRLAASVVDNTSEGVMVVDENGLIVSVNPAFTQITGYSAEEAVGQTPRLLRSDYHDQAFYQAMLQTLLSTGRWQGEIWNRRKNGEIYPEWLTINLIPDPAGGGCYVGVFTDFTEQRRKEERIRHLAFHDALTGLPNRSLLFDRLQHAILKAEREKRRVAVMFLDLDRFKAINDSLGHEVGDLLLQEVAKRLTTCLRGTDTVARLGGDEFVILLEDLESPEDVAGVAANLIGVLALPQEIADYTLQVEASIGIALYPEDGNGAIELMKAADTAMYAAKGEKGKGFRFFHAAMTEQATRRLQMEDELRRAVQEGQFELHYQPLVDMASGQPLSVEVLVRWQHPERGILLPEEFLPLAEGSGLSRDIGDWVLDQACRQMAEWQTRGIGLRLSVNIFARQLGQEGLAASLAARVRAQGIDPGQLQIEVAEAVLMADPARYAPTLAQLRQLGISVALDDFGSGRSSLGDLGDLPLDLIKIDNRFIAGATAGEGDARVVRGAVALGTALGLPVAAEGVETLEQAAWLRQNGCALAQGYLFCSPLPADVAELWLATRSLSLGR